MASTVLLAWRTFLDEVGRGFPKLSLGSGELEAATELLELGTLLDGIERVAASRPVGYRYSFIHRPHLTRIARRCLLGRFPDRIERHRGLWVDNGTSPAVVDLAVQAAGRCHRGDWPGQIIEAGSQETSTHYSRAHADFVEMLQRIEREDKSGPFGDAIRSSRYAPGVKRCGPPLQGEFDFPTGFPIVGLAGKQPELGRRDSAWVEPESDWAGWLSEQNLLISAHDSTLYHEKLTYLREQFRILEESISRVLRSLASLDLPEDHPGFAPPEWLALYALQFGIESLDSAGLSLALQRLAELQGRPIPAGVGFTGAWGTGRLCKVTGIEPKLLAAREAGIFVLFACACLSPEAVTRLKEQAPGPGVVLVLLEEGLTLDDVVVRVNTVCHDLGLTEYRWRRVVEGWERRVQGMGGPGGQAELLPNAATAPEKCPVGFIGRESLLGELDRRKEEIDATGGRGHLALVGSPRSGKTTTLSHWLSPGHEAWLRRPIWFSFQRQRSHASTRDDLVRALREQIESRFCVLLDQEMRGAAGLTFGEFVRTVADSTRSRIDLAVDGLDEAVVGEQKSIAELLLSLSLPTGSILIVGTQPILASEGFTNRILIGEHPVADDAGALIDRFAARFDGSSKAALENIGALLKTDHWRSGLVEKTHGNLWILTDFLRSTERQGDRARWPKSPDELPLTDDVNDYCKVIFGEIRSSSGEAWGDLQAILIKLAILDDVPWRIEDLWVLRGLQMDASAFRNMRDRILDHTTHLVQLEEHSGRLSFRDVCFRDYLRKRNGPDALEVAQRLVDLVDKRPDRNHSKELIRYAVERSAWHVINDVADDDELAARLVFDTDWVPARLATLFESSSTIDAFLDELARLRIRVERARSKSIAQLDALYRALWEQRDRIRDRPELVTQWWRGLAPVRIIDIWKKKSVPEASSLRACQLLIPHDGYSLEAQEDPIPIGSHGQVCELPGQRLVMRCPGGLAVYSFSIPQADQRFVPLSFDPIQIAAFGLDAVILRGKIGGFLAAIRVDIVSGKQFPLDFGGAPIGLAVLSDTSPASVGRTNSIPRVIAIRETRDTPAKEPATLHLILQEDGKNYNLGKVLPDGSRLDGIDVPIESLGSDRFLVRFSPSRPLKSHSMAFKSTDIAKTRIVFLKVDSRRAVHLIDATVFRKYRHYHIIGACPAGNDRIALFCWDSRGRQELVLVIDRDGRVCLINRIIEVGHNCWKLVGWSERSGLILGGDSRHYSLHLTNPECVARSLPNAPAPFTMNVLKVLSCGEILGELNSGLILIDPVSLTGRSITPHKTILRQHIAYEKLPKLEYVQEGLSFPSFDRPETSFSYVAMEAPGFDTRELITEERATELIRGYSVGTLRPRHPHLAVLPGLSKVIQGFRLFKKHELGRGDIIYMEFANKRQLPLPLTRPHPFKALLKEDLKCGRLEWFLIGAARPSPNLIHLEIGIIFKESWTGPILAVYEWTIDEFHETLIELDQGRPIDFTILGERESCFAYLGNRRLAVGHPKEGLGGGRMEVVELPAHLSLAPPPIVAVGYLESNPSELIVHRGNRGSFLVAIPKPSSIPMRLTWFPLPDDW
jgi:hypothetical protein